MRRLRQEGTTTASNRSEVVATKICWTSRHETKRNIHNGSCCAHQRNEHRKSTHLVLHSENGSIFLNKSRQKLARTNTRGAPMSNRIRARNSICSVASCRNAYRLCSLSLFSLIWVCMELWRKAHPHRKASCNELNGFDVSKKSLLHGRSQRKVSSSIRSLFNLANLAIRGGASDCFRFSAYSP